jgi:hypothetical protein
MARPLSGSRDLVLAAIEAAANDGRPCPTDPELNLIGQGGSRFGAETLGWLKRQGVIEIERLGRQRRVTIIATGRKTAFVYRHYAIGNRQAETLPPRVDRDPCPRCGVRRDIGCVHSSRALGTTFGLTA